MNMLQQIIVIFGNYTPIISFAGAIIGGEETLVFLSILTAEGHLNVWELLLFFYLGINVSDVMWYGLGRSRLIVYAMRNKTFLKAYQYWGSLISAVSKGSVFHALFFTKFIYGARIPTIMYFAQEQVAPLRYVGYTVLLNLFWTLVIFAVGWFSGKGILLATSISENIVLYLTLAGLVTALLGLFAQFISNKVKIWIQEKREQ